MTRVRKAARKLKAETFEGSRMEANRVWIRQKKAEGYEIFDIGPAFDRRLDRKLKGKTPDSRYYGMERQETKDYSINKLWERKGKWDGGSWFLNE